MIITIDGPTASGKSSVARKLAHLLKFRCMNSGLLYRALAYVLSTRYGYTKQNFAKPKDKDITQALSQVQIVYPEAIECGIIIIDDKDVTDELKTDVIDRYSSLIATHAFVRESINKLQHLIANHKDMVVEGRDMATVVFPYADVKFFLTAAPEVRAKRWQADQAKKKNILSLEEAVAALQERDTRDSNRAVAPLEVAQDAIVIDNSALTVQETVQKMMNHIQKKNSRTK